MARACSLDLRERVAAAVASGRSCREAAAASRVSVASVVRWSRRRRETGGGAAALPTGGRRPLAPAGERDRLPARWAEKPDLTLRARVAGLAERGIAVSYYAVRHRLGREGVSFKTYGPPRRQAASRPDLRGLRQRIRPRSDAPGPDGDPRGPVLKSRGVVAPFFEPGCRSAGRPFRPSRCTACRRQRPSGLPARPNRSVTPAPRRSRRSPARCAAPPRRSAQACWRAPPRPH